MDNLNPLNSSNSFLAICISACFKNCRYLAQMKTHALDSLKAFWILLLHHKCNPPKTQFQSKPACILGKPVFLLCHWLLSNIEALIWLINKMKIKPELRIGVVSCFQTTFQSAKLKKKKCTVEINTWNMHISKFLPAEEWHTLELLCTISKFTLIWGEWEIKRFVLTREEENKRGGGGVY